MASSHDRRQRHEAFWQGQGPSLLFTPTATMTLYSLADYESRFHDPAAMHRSELERAEPVVDWPTDGIPTVRPNLGTIFIPAIAGQDYIIQEEQMPWPGKHFSIDRIASLRDLQFEKAELLNLALSFYAIHRNKTNEHIRAYLPDTQGVFDILHLLRGNELFYDMADEALKSTIKELLEIITELYVSVSHRLKEALDEPAHTMVHGHGTQQGLFFPHAGVRLAEDTATLLSPAMIDEFVIPSMEAAARPFGGAFVHFCGQHEYLFERIVTCPFVKAIDLGNPESYDTAWLMETCSQTDTVLYSRLAANDGETWQAYIKRLATLVQRTQARCVLRPEVFPADRDECQEMLDMWHELTLIK